MKSKVRKIGIPRENATEQYVYIIKCERRIKYSIDKARIMVLNLCMVWTN